MRAKRQRLHRRLEPIARANSPTRVRQRHQKMALSKEAFNLYLVALQVQRERTSMFKLLPLDLVRRELCFKLIICTKEIPR